METLKQTLLVPADHKIQLDITLPDSFPTGEAEVVVIFAPKIATQNNTNKLLKLAGKLHKSSHFGGDPLLLQKALRDEWKQ